MPNSPAPWTYESRLTLLRDNRRRLDALTSDVTPLVAAGDPLSLSRAAQLSTQAAHPDKQPSWMEGIADTFRQIVPQDARDVLGGTARALTSAESFGNLLDQALHNSPSANLRDIAPGTAGTTIGETLDRIPGVGGAARTAFDVGASPLSVVTAGTGGLGASALGNTFASRIAAQAAGAIGGKYGSEAASKGAAMLGGDELAQGVAGFAGGLVGGVGGISAAKSITAGLGALGGAEEAAALRDAAGPVETSLPSNLGTAVPTDLGTRFIRAVRGGDNVPDDIAALYAKMQSGAEITQAERIAAEDFIRESASISPTGIRNTETPSGGLQPDLARTNLIRSRRGLPPLTETPPGWKQTAEAAVPEPSTIGPLTEMAQLQTDLKREGLTPQQILADPRYQKIASEVFQNTTPPWEQPPPAVRPGGEGERIGNSIIDRFQQSLEPQPAPGLSPEEQSFVRGNGPMTPEERRLAERLGVRQGINEPPPPPSEYAAGFDNSPLFNPDAGYRQPFEFDPETGRPTKWVTNQGQILEGPYGTPQATPITAQERLEIARVTAENRTSSGAAEGINDPARVSALRAGEVLPPRSGGLAGASSQGGLFDAQALEGAPSRGDNRSLEALLAEQTMAGGGVPTSQAINPERAALLEGGGQPPFTPNRGRQLGMGGLPESEQPRGSLWQNIKDLLSAPRQTMTGGDVSASTRQAGMAAPSHPTAYVNAMRDQISALRSPEAAQAVMDRIDANPLRPVFDRMGLDLLPLESNNPLTQEEAFQHGSTMVSRAIAKLPLIERTQRAYTTALNSFRSRIAEDILTSRYTPEEIAQLPDQHLKEIGAFVNAITGRGSIPKFLEDHSQSLNTIFFSPRNTFGKVQANLALFSTNPVVRAEAAKSLAAFYGTGAGILAAASLAGLKVGTTPTSSDFGKIELPGGTKVDIWGGNQQLFRLIANLTTGNTTSATTGQTYPQDRLTTVTRFLRNKLAPLPGQALDVVTGVDSSGQKMSYTPSSLAAQAVRLTTPLFLQDLYDATAAAGPGEGLAAGALSAIGIGAQANTNAALDNAARDRFGVPFNRLEPYQKAQVRKIAPQEPSSPAEVARAQIKAQQTADDAQLLSGKITVQQWQDAKGKRQDVLAGRLQQIYGSNPISDEDAKRDPLTHFAQIVQQSTDQSTGRVNWDLVDAAKSQLPASAQEYIDRNTGVNATPLTQTYRKAAQEYYALPRYKGYTADEAQSIDSLWQQARNNARSADDLDILVALRKVSQDADPKIVTGVRRRFVGALIDTTDRKQWIKRNPDLAPLVTRSGALTAKDQQALAGVR